MSKMTVKQRFTLIKDYKCSTWFAELLFPVIGSVQIYTAFFFAALFGDLMYYHGLLILPILLLLTGVACNIAGSTVNYERFAELPQSRRLMIGAAFVSVTSSFICYFYLLFYVSSKLDLSNMHLYATDVFTKKMIDKTQILLQCCGNDCYSDWFSVDWQATDIEPWHSYPPNGVMSRLAVPHSCCSWNATPPCTNNYLNLQEGQGLNKEGCRRALMVRFSSATFMQATAMLAVGILQISWILCTAGVVKGDIESGKKVDTPLQDTAKKASSCKEVGGRALSSTSAARSVDYLASDSSSEDLTNVCGIFIPKACSSSGTEPRDKSSVSFSTTGRESSPDEESMEMVCLDLEEYPEGAGSEGCRCLFPGADKTDEDLSRPSLVESGTRLH